MNHDQYATEADTQELIRVGKLPAALALADSLEKTMQSPLHGKAADELRRLHQCEQAFNEWIDKTAWVQDSAKPGELGLHRADVLKARIERLERELAVAESMHRVAVQQRDQAWRELEQLAESVSQRLQQSGQNMAAELIREVFIACKRPAVP